MAADSFRTALESEGFWPQAGPVRSIETLISILFLVGNRAYKLKKRVNFGFVDFSTPDRRRFYCEEELRLNRRLAPDLYLGVRRITGPFAKPEFEGSGEAVDYVVEMHRFDQRDLMDRAEEEGRLTMEDVEGLAKTVAAFHEGAPRAPSGSPFGNPAEVAKPMAENFRHLLRGGPEKQEEALLRRLESWARKRQVGCHEAFKARKRDGRIRECHGDLHLGNILLRDGGITIFDCIEFNENLRWIDVASDVAFCAMDLASRGRDRMAHVFLNSCLEISGDYGGTAVLPYYLCYRALVRTKVAWLRIQTGKADRRAADPETEDDYRRHLTVAGRYAFERSPHLIVMHGLSGTGKSYGSRKIVESTGAIRIRSDVERKRIRPGIAGDRLYTPEMNRLTYERMHAAATDALKAGFAVILDATYLRAADRAEALEIADRSGAPRRILNVTAERDTVEERLRKRAAQGADPSDADAVIVRNQAKSIEPLTEAELACAINVDTDDPASWGKAIRAVSGLAR